MPGVAASALHCTALHLYCTVYPVPYCTVPYNHNTCWCRIALNTTVLLFPVTHLHLFEVMAEGCQSNNIQRKPLRLGGHVCQEAVLATTAAAAAAAFQVFLPYGCQPARPDW